MKSTGFLFINKTTASSRLGGSNGSEATAIQHFVQKGRKRARKAKLVSAFQVTPEILRRDACVNDNSPRADRSMRNKDSTDKSRTPRHSAETKTKLNESSVVQRNDSEILLVRTKDYHPSQYVVSAAADPFHNASIRLDREIQSLLHYYTTIFHPTLWPNETQALRRGAYIFEDGVNHIVLYSLQDSLAMYCLLASAASRIVYLDKLPSLTSSIKVDWYMKRALSLMQQRIDEQSLQPRGSLLYLLQYMTFLSAAEAYRDNHTASRIHLEAGVKLLAHEGLTVVDVQPQNLQGMMLMSDLFLSCIKLEPCRFDSDIYDPGFVCKLRLTSHELLDIDTKIAPMAGGFEECGILSESTKVLVTMIKEVYQVKLCLNTTCMTAARALETTHWITKRNMAIRNRLLSVFHNSQSKNELPMPILIPAEPDLRDLLDKSIRIALIQFTLLSMNITGRIKTVKVMAPFLRRHLAPVLTEKGLEPHLSRDLIVWLLVIGYSCALDDSSTEKWFARHCLEESRAQTTIHLKEGSSASRLIALEEWQANYFYHAAVQRPRLKRLLHDVQDFS